MRCTTSPLALPEFACLCTRKCLSVACVLDPGVCLKLICRVWVCVCALPQRCPVVQAVWRHWRLRLLEVRPVSPAVPCSQLDTSCLPPLVCPFALRSRLTGGTAGTRPLDPVSAGPGSSAATTSAAAPAPAPAPASAAPATSAAPGPAAQAPSDAAASVALPATIVPGETAVKHNADFDYLECPKCCTCMLLTDRVLSRLCICDGDRLCQALHCTPHHDHCFRGFFLGE
jgi:hypothetical protein